MTIHLNLGSNLGARVDTLNRAMSLLGQVLPGRLTCSSPIETAAWGYESSNKFVNIGVMIELAEEFIPEEILRIVNEVQRTIDSSPHRDSAGRYIDRKIDIDIVAIDELIVNTPQLTVPHPRMHLRSFVLEPFMQLAPGWRHPLLHLTPSEMLKAL